MASFDDDADPAVEDEFDNEDEEMEDANDQEADGDQDQDDDQNEEDEDEGGDDEDNDNDNDDDEDEEQNEADSPTRRASQHVAAQRSASEEKQTNPAVVLTSPSPRMSTVRSPNGLPHASFVPPTRPEALTAMAYDIVPTMAAPQSTSINAIATTPDMRWVFSGGTDGYVRMFNWIETANGKVPLTVAQKHPFVDSVMKAGSLVTYWENEEPSLRTPPRDGDEGKWTSPVYSLAVQHQAIWLLSGLESGGINLQTCRHQAGTRITTLKKHTSAVSVLTLSQDETNVLSGSWDKNILDWDLQTGQVKREFSGSGSQVSAVETRPISELAIPEVSEQQPEALNDTFSSNNNAAPFGNGDFMNGHSSHQDSIGTGGEADAVGSPSGSLFGEGDHGSLFGEDTGGAGGNAFGEEDDELTQQLTNDLENGADADAPGEEVDGDTEMGGIGSGGPVQPPEPIPDEAALEPASLALNDTQEKEQEQAPEINGVNHQEPATDTDPTADTTLANGFSHPDEPLSAPTTSTHSLAAPTNAADLPPQSESTFLSAAIDGTLRIWDRRIPNPIATIRPHGSTPPWCTGACWSPDGNTFYAGRRNNTVEEYSIHHLGAKQHEPNRVFRFQAGSGPVSAVRAMPNRKHLVCASNDILRIYDLAQAESKRSTVPFTIVPGHRGGMISAIHIDASCRFMLSAAGNRGWEGFGTEVLLGYEIGVQDQSGVWHK